MGKIQTAEEIDALIKVSEEQIKQRKERVKKLTKYNLPTELKEKSGSLKRKEKKALKSKTVEVGDYDDEGNPTKKSVSLTLQNAELYPDANDAFVDELAELRDIELDDLEESDIGVWLEIITFRTISPLEYEGK